MTNLTIYEQQVVNFIETEQLAIGSGGWGPELHQICKALGKDSTSVRGYLGSLVKKGLVYVEDGQGDRPDLYMISGLEVDD